MIALNSLEYRKAFSNYLRRGTPIHLHLSLKAEDADHPTTHYIWRTRGDPQVRPSHMENNGKVFAWDNPPAAIREKTIIAVAQQNPMNGERVNMRIKL